MEGGSLLVNVTITAASLLLHIAFKWMEFRESNGSPSASIQAYLQAKPARTAIAVISSFLVFVVVYEMDWMNPIAALTAGWLNSSLIDNLANRGKSMIGG